jgi:hypothetical protein
MKRAAASLAGRRTAVVGRSDHFGFSLFEMAFAVPCLGGGEDCSSSGRVKRDAGLIAQAWMKRDIHCAQFRSRREGHRENGVKNPNGSQADGG